MFDEETPIEEMGLPDPLADIIRSLTNQSQKDAGSELVCSFCEREGKTNKFESYEDLIEHIEDQHWSEFKEEYGKMAF